ncbi:MAG: hypothetical protein ABR540_14070 [Acidimicrobiales bacterium]|nr:hypothetical protein [Actinomycetota bacterium]
MSGGVEDLRARLEGMAEELADLSLDRLREAAGSPDERDRLMAEERRFTRARRAVEKAAMLLSDRTNDDV